MKKAILMTAVMILFSGGLTAALGGEEAQAVSGGEEPPAETNVQSEMDSGRGGCGCRNQGPAASDVVSNCGARKSGQGAGGKRHRQEQGAGQGMGRGMGYGKGKGPAEEKSGCGRGGNQDVMQATRALVHQYRGDIVREVEDVPNGVVTVTRSPENPEAVPVLQRHVGEMKGLLEGGGRIRAWDPLFTEIFDHTGEIEMIIETLEDGVKVTETSANPEVVKLIRAHARKVNEFVARGPAAVHEPTSLPDDYRDSE